MASFTLRGITLDVPDHALRGGLDQALKSGRYEHSEADALMRHLQPQDRMLDLGAGAGYLCCLAAGVVGADQVAGVEASPEMAGVALANLQRNGFAAARIEQAAVVAPGRDGHARFGLRPAFWASALMPAHGEAPKNATGIEVPAISLPALFSRHAPTVMTCDIEGAEREVLNCPMPADLRVIVIEVHPQFYGAAGTRQLFDGLSAQGYGYVPEGSRGATVVFGRI